MIEHLILETGYRIKTEDDSGYILLESSTIPTVTGAVQGLNPVNLVRPIAPDRTE